MLNSLVVKSMIKKEIETEGIPDTEARKEIGDHTGNTNNPHNVTKVQVGLEKVDNTSDVDKPVSKEQQKAIDSAKNNANEYTDQKIADLINGAPTTLDTLKEIADAMEENQDVVKALDESIGTKANASDLTDHTGNTNNPHSVTKKQLGLEDAVESEVAIDFSEAETPQFQQTIDDVLDGVNELKSDLDKYKEDVYSFNTILPIYKSVSGWKLNASDGLCSSDNAYKLVKFKIIAGKLYNISGSEKFQFQGTEAVPVSGTPNRIGITYQSDGYAIAPIGAEYLIISTLEKANVTVKDGEPLPKKNKNDVTNLKRKEVWRFGFI